MWTGSIAKGAHTSHSRDIGRQCSPCGDKSTRSFDLVRHCACTRLERSRGIPEHGAELGRCSAQRKQQSDVLDCHRILFIAETIDFPSLFGQILKSPKGGSPTLQPNGFRRAAEVQRLVVPLRSLRRHRCMLTSHPLPAKCDYAAILLLAILARCHNPVTAAFGVMRIWTCKRTSERLVVRSSSALTHERVYTEEVIIDGCNLCCVSRPDHSGGGNSCDMAKDEEIEKLSQSA